MAERNGKTTHLPRMALGLLGALALGGCAATHVGDDWQCPLAQGQVCTSVAAADPAVAEAAEPEELPARAPLHRARPAAVAETATGGAAPGCGEGCNPLAWLTRLFEANRNDPGPGGGVIADGSAVEVVVTALPSDAERDRGGVGSGVAAVARVNTAESAGDEPIPASGGLRTGETIGRIWIAPFVDAGGVYHEASWVRAVLEPAGWRLP